MSINRPFWWNTDELRGLLFRRLAIIPLSWKGPNTFTVKSLFVRTSQRAATNHYCRENGGGHDLKKGHFYFCHRSCIQYYFDGPAGIVVKYRIMTKEAANSPENLLINWIWMIYIQRFGVKKPFLVICIFHVFRYRLSHVLFYFRWQLLSKMTLNSAVDYKGVSHTYFLSI